MCPPCPQDYLPVVHILCNPGLRLRHWEKMSEAIGFNITPDSGTSLRKMIKSVERLVIAASNHINCY